ncbi:hypothetical protein JZ785_08370 [Alicyclobacillus curvatus]|nr:hypothetical protein JZ785_08370 [Alicyclobacillus curvatus]
MRFAVEVNPFKWRQAIEAEVMQNIVVLDSHYGRQSSLQAPNGVDSHRYRRQME